MTATFLFLNIKLTIDREEKSRKNKPDEMDLKNIIIQKIKAEGPISFRDFMDMALYYPDHGYYTSAKHIVGKRGDFFTSPYISSAFGAMVGRQIEEFSKQMNGPFTIVEFGAGTGLLCHDILEYLKLNPTFYHSLRYVIIEKSPVARRLLQKYLPEKVIWMDRPENLGQFQGCILSNELFDNFPIHRIVVKDREIKEIFIDFQSEFYELLKPAGPDITDNLKLSDTTSPRTIYSEFCLDASEWFRNISGHLNKGYIISIDYGYPGSDLCNLTADQNTLRCYHNHQVNDNPYQEIGDQDITADVNFYTLHHWGRQNGFEFDGFVNQANFLRALGFVPYLSEMNDSEENKKFAMNTLINRMGIAFKVLIQRKGLDHMPLRGLSLASPFFTPANAAFNILPVKNLRPCQASDSSNIFR